MRGWARRTAALHDELAAVAEVGAGDPRWWLVAGGAALAGAESGGDSATYVLSDAEPSADTFIGHAAAAPIDPLAHAIARAHAARDALRELDGQLPAQPLAVAIRRTATGAVAVPNALELAAIVVGDRVIRVRLADDVARFDVAQLDAASAPGGVPFVTVALGDEPIETARHGHRRGWAANGVSVGPWLGLGRAGGLDLVSTCHMIVDGYGHAWLAARIAEHTRRLAPRVPRLPPLAHPPLAPVPGAIPLAIAWRDLDGPAPRALPLAYALGQLLHRAAGRPDARFSPTFQIPIAPGATDDPARRRRRVVPAITSVRFDGGVPEPFDRFAARTRDTMAREAEGFGLASCLLAAARAAPAPLAWKRRAAGPARPRWLAAVADVIGGRGCLSKIRLDAPTSPACAVSSPARLATPGDPLGGCVITVVDDGSHAAVTLSGSGNAGAATMLEALFELLP